MRRRFGFVFEKVHGFEAGVVIDEDEKVLVSRELGTEEGAGYVGMEEATGIGCFVERRVVRVPCGVGFRASGASVVARLSE
eukprot:6212507-Pleurochrysis_carterae.AAC.2